MRPRFHECRGVYSPAMLKAGTPRRVLLSLAIAALGASAVLFRIQNPQGARGLKISSLPAAQPVPAGQPEFGAALIGGGGDVDEAARFLCQHSHGGELVVLRASGGDAYNSYFHGLCPNNSVTTVLTTSVEGGHEPAAVEHVREANAIFIAGGDQSNYVKFWTGPLQREINAAIARGVPIGGTSAGLAVLGEFAFSAMHDTITSPEALANPYDAKMTIERDFLAVPVLHGIITDSHFSPRQRMGRTVAFLARIEQEGWASPARAIGIDEATAVLVEANGQATVVGKGSAYFLELSHRPDRCEPGQPLTVHDVRAYQISTSTAAHPTAQFALQSWTATGGTLFTINVTEGAMTRTDERQN